MPHRRPELPDQEQRLEGAVVEDGTHRRKTLDHVPSPLCPWTQVGARACQQVLTRSKQQQARCTAMWVLPAAWWPAFEQGTLITARSF